MITGSQRVSRWIKRVLGGLVVLAIAAIALWQWAVANSSAATLNTVDAIFPRSHAVKLATSAQYGSVQAQQLELWVPEGEPPATGWPLVAFIHGGSWQNGSPQDYRFIARTLGDHGYATALIGYRLLPEGRFPIMLEDSAAAVAWLHTHAGDFQADGRQFALIGHSAGAYNSLMVGLDPEWLARVKVPQSVIQGVVSMAGPADFYPFTSQSTKAAFGRVADPQITQPIHFARGTAMPILLLHGTGDESVKPRNSRNLAKAIKARGGLVAEQEFAGMTHSGIIMALAQPFAQTDDVLKPILTFLTAARAKPIAAQDGS
jgi:acetyl esterase/lipase